MYNSADGTVQKISRDQVGGYDMEKLEELQNTEDAPTDVGQLHWIINPTPSEDNSLVAYQSNRRTYEDFVRRYREDGEKEGFRIGLYLEDDIWYIDMATGEESLLVEDAAAIVWAGRTLIYSRDTDVTLWRIDVDTKKTEPFPPGDQTVSWPKPIDRQGRFLIEKGPVGRWSVQVGHLGFPYRYPDRMGSRPPNQRAESIPRLGFYGRFGYGHGALSYRPQRAA